MKKIILLLVFTLFTFCLGAQSVNVNVHVVDEKGKPMKEVIIKLSEQESNLTDENGNATFSAEKGMKIRVIKANAFEKIVTVNSENVTVVLDSKSRIYDLGWNRSITKELSSAAIDGIGYEDIQNATQTQILNTLFGMIPGLAVYQGGTGAWPDSNAPGLLVRGVGSYMGTHVMVLVDGISRDASSIDVDEVESVSVLKDAAALAIYGIRGADGAILITTKRGGAHRFNISSGYSFGVQTPTGMPEMASPIEYANALNEARANDGLTPYFSASNINDIASGNSSVIPSVNWKDYIMRNIGFNNDVHLSLDGSSRLAKYFVYADYRSNRGFFKNTGINSGANTQNAYDGLKLRTNLDVVITPTTDVVINLGARIQQGSGPLSIGSFSSMYTTPSVGLPIKYNDVWARSTLFANPVQSILGSGSNTTFARMLTADLAVRQDLGMLLKGLKAELRLSYDNTANITDNKSFGFSYYNFSPIYDEDGNLSDYSTTRYGNDTGMSFSSWLSGQYMHMSAWGKLNWTRDLGQHHIDASLLFNREKRTNTGANSSYIHHDFVLGASYNYGGRYLASISASYSGSSFMPKGDKFRVYPAVSLGWLASNEEFLKNSNVVDYLKLRGSYGMVGMDYNLSYDMDVQFNGGGRSYIFVTPSAIGGQQEGALPSTGIEPELDTKADLGLEFTLFHGLSGEIDGFYNKRTNIRTTTDNTTSSVLGIGMGNGFNGETTNYGVELSLGWKQNIGDLSYSIQGNVSWTKNKIDKYEEIYHPYSYQNLQGTKIGQFYGLVSDGYYQKSDFDSDGNLLSSLPSNTFETVQPGDVKYKDLNNDNKIDNYDYTYQLESGTPEFYYGAQIGLQWKGIGFRAWLQGMTKYTLLTNVSSVYQPLYGNNKNISKHYLESYWTESNPEGRYPRLTTITNSNNYLTSNLWSEKGGFLKLREIEVSYTLPKAVTDKAKLGEVVFLLRGNNLFSIDNIGIFDPEYISLGYPTAKTYSVGVNVTF